MSNYPLGADDDPFAPWNQDPDEWDEEEYEDEYEDLYEDEEDEEPQRLAM